ncbi:MAG: hypothetical protein CM1200mP3_13580 [Chloroflexota bacterium]|nr:MAG: hypothetical protein CM1200mP3_13580 [Chloroflexota bacterium]
MKIDNYELNHPDRIDTPAMITTGTLWNKTYPKL